MAASSVITMADIDRVLNFNPDEAGLPDHRKKKSRPASAAVRRSGRSQTEKQRGSSANRRSRPASAVRTRQRISTESEDDKLRKDLRKAHNLNYNNNNLDKAKIDRTQDAKAMSRYYNEAEVYAGVDHQIRQKQLFLEKEAEIEREWDEKLEMQRLQAVHKAKEEERRRQEKQAYTVQTTYLEDMENRRIREDTEDNELERERLHVQRQVQAYEEEKMRLKQEKKERARRLKKESIDYQRRQAQQKLRKAREENEEEARVYAYQQEKNTQESIRDNELQRQKKEAELVTAKLRSKQKKFKDVQAQRDEELMLRYQQEFNTKELKKTRSILREKERRNRETMEMRLQQVREKADQIAKDAESERKQYDEMLKRQEEEKMRIARKEEKRKQANDQYKQDLLAQIAANEKKISENNRSNLKGAVINRAVENECLSQALEEARQQKLAALRKQGIPEFYARKLSQYQLKNVQ